MVSRKSRNERGESHDDPERYTYREARELESDAFEDGGVNRRTFLSVAAATGAALALPSVVSGDVTHDSMTAEAQFAVNATPQEYEVHLVLEFTDVASVSAFGSEFCEPGWNIETDSAPPKAVTREDPTPAAHAYLTAEELETVFESVVDPDSIEHIDHSIGANPFWKLDDWPEDDTYSDRVFPAVENARDYMNNAESYAGLSYLQERYPDRINLREVGQSPGWENVRTGDETDPKDVFIAEVTNNVQDRDVFEQKEKAIYEVNIHGRERAGEETGTRYIEDLVTGEADQAELLDDIAILFLFVNPDGYFSRLPELVDPEYLEFTRGNASSNDTNRQYPTIGWIDPNNYPGEPEDAPEEYYDIVPDAIATVEFLRQYENVRYLVDYHQMGTREEFDFVWNLEANAQRDHRGVHLLEESNVRVGERMEAELGFEGFEADVERALEDWFDEPDQELQDLFDYGTVDDTLGYNISGGLLDWAGQPLEDGGLDAVAVVPEMVFAGGGEEWYPYMHRHLETAYRIQMEVFAELTAADVDATVHTGGRDVAYVDSDELTRSSADLTHTDESPDHEEGPGHETPVEITREQAEVLPGFDGRLEETVHPQTRCLSVHVEPDDDAAGVVEIVNPNGEVVRKLDVGELGHSECCHSGNTEFYISDPPEGTWVIKFDGDGEITVEVVIIDSDDGHLDPEEIMGFYQREYSANPMEFFAELDEFVEDADVNGLSVDDVRTSGLVDRKHRQYDTLVVSGEMACDDPSYVRAIESFVEAGGDLVLTDAGVRLLGALEIGDAAEIGDGAIDSFGLDFVNVYDRDLDHPLLDGVREIQHELWKAPQVGYTPDEDDQPVYAVDEDAFEAAGGHIVGTFGDEAEDDELSGVGLGTLTVGDCTIYVIASILPPANQEYLHQFGMADHAVSTMGHTVLCNAIGGEQRRYVDGELAASVGTPRGESSSG
ncbi:M14 family zinc carboxypeptidase [Natronococcus occultus]|uniref:Zinc carboxypeptidase n=1 Tax=Natronococcus occultus SP4 TaxID=694430 RepID=L0JWI8_9EURY|nr:M14 family zinc carboxypeptidase [Natronococcus occultus]AGB36675.1 Zinc carboxypeptidase [Natronococcus occultus SP4]